MDQPTLHPIPVIARMDKDVRFVVRELTAAMDRTIWRENDLTDGRSFNQSLHFDQALLVQEYFESLGWYVVLWRYHDETAYYQFDFRLEDPGIDRSRAYLLSEYEAMMESR